ncbi:MAG: hypothetical protein ACK4PN_10230 [Allorhizobium sp.]
MARHDNIQDEKSRFQNNWRAAGGYSIKETRCGSKPQRDDEENIVD